MKLDETFFKYFGDLEYPRKQNQHLKHYLSDIIAISVLATTCGANNMVEICELAQASLSRLKGILDIKSKNI